MVPIAKYYNIGSEIGLAPVSWQTIILTNGR